MISFGSLLALASGLAMDAAAVSAARGFATPLLRVRHALLVAVFFGGFQGLMPLLGWLLGRQLGPIVASWDHWIAFVLLGGIGGKMLWEAREAKAEPTDAEKPNSAEALYALPVLLALAVATSIDAFAVGIMLPMLGADLILSSLTIGVTTACLSILALIAGRHFGAMFGKKLDALGGLVLIALGTKVLIEHLSAG
ncbi:MAG TPA: manganese efflux pump MntP family protein [Polyangiaceae bacterium]|nr:manganese efflux pump MntP family protein [Polyangiaceae bacterium]